MAVGTETTLGTIFLTLLALMINGAIVLVNRQNNANKAASNQLDFQKAYITLSESDRKKADEDRERLLRIEKQFDAEMDRNKEKDKVIAALRAELTEAEATMAKDKVTISTLTVKLDDAAKQLAEIPLLREQMKALSAEVQMLRAEIETMRVQHTQELAARDAVIKAKDAEIVVLKTENTDLKAKLAASQAPPVTTVAPTISAPESKP